MGASHIKSQEIEIQKTVLMSIFTVLFMRLTLPHSCQIFSIDLENKCSQATVVLGWKITQ